MKGLKHRLSLALMGLFLIMGIVLALVPRHASVQYNLEMTQRLNGSIAMYVAEADQLIENGVHNEAAIKRLAERAMVINPTVEVYLLDTEGRILSHNLPADTALVTRVPLDAIERFMAPDSPRPLLSMDPRNGASDKAFSAAPVTFQGRPEGYVYAILGGQAYEALARDLSRSYAMSLAVAAIAAVMLVFYGIGVLVFNQLTRPLTRLTREVRAFQQEMTGERAPALAPGEDVRVLRSAFETMRKTIEEQVKQIQAADQNRRDLITNVSHDLRTPLAAIQGYIETLNMKADALSDGQRQAYLETANLHCQRLNTLINDLFELSKLDSAALMPDIETFSLAELMQDVGMEFAMLAERKNIALRIEVDSPHAEVRADIALMQRVFENLIGNALKHTPENGTVWLRLVPEGNQYQVMVEDTGRGISQQELPYIFDRLYRADNSSNYNRNSSGLGLAIVKRILDVHEIRIKVASQLEQGTQFSFLMPVASA